MYCAIPIMMEFTYCIWAACVLGSVYRDIFLTSYNKVTVQGAAASRVFFHLKAEAVRMGEQIA